MMNNGVVLCHGESKYSQHKLLSYPLFSLGIAGPLKKPTVKTM